MLMNDKIMFDGYYCINLTIEHCENKEIIGALFCITASHFFLCKYAIHESDRGQVLII